MANPRLCSIPGCDKAVRARGWCNGHWIKWTRYGDPLLGQRPRDEAKRFLYEAVVPHLENRDCLFWPYSRDSHGYGRIGLEGKRKQVHRVVCEATHGSPPSPTHEAAHSCGKGHLGCVNPHHLLWKTRADNFADKLVHGTHNRGELNGYSSITEDQARKILSLRGTMSQQAIANEVGTTRGVVMHIFRGNSWKWLR